MNFDPKKAFADPLEERRGPSGSCASCGESERIEVRRHYDTYRRTCQRCGLSWQAGIGAASPARPPVPDAEELTARPSFAGAAHRVVGPDFTPEE